MTNIVVRHLEGGKQKVTNMNYPVNHLFGAYVFVDCYALELRFWTTKNVIYLYDGVKHMSLSFSVLQYLGKIITTYDLKEKISYMDINKNNLIKASTLVDKSET